MLDVELDGQFSVDVFGDGDDEDGVILFLFNMGNFIDVLVMFMNMIGEDVKLVFFIDWNGDGDFGDFDEMYDFMVFDGVIEVIFENVMLLLIFVIGDQQVGVCFWISIDVDVVMSLIGIVLDGEVEDYLIFVFGLDFGDLNDIVFGIGGDFNDLFILVDYVILWEGNGLCYCILVDLNNIMLLKIGIVVDDEVNGQFSVDVGVMVGGDDNIVILDIDLDDEDGFDLDNFLLFILI